MLKYQKFNSLVKIGLASELLEVPVAVVRRWSDEGKIPCIRKNRHRLFDMREVFRSWHRSPLIDEEVREELFDLVAQRTRDREVQWMWPSSFNREEAAEMAAIGEFHRDRRQGFSKNWKVTELLKFPPKDIYRRSPQTSTVSDIPDPSCVGSLESICLDLLDTFWRDLIQVEIENVAKATFAYRDGFDEHGRYFQFQLVALERLPR